MTRASEAGFYAERPGPDETVCPPFPRFHHGLQWSRAPLLRQGAANGHQETCRNSACGAPDRGRHRRGLRRIRLPGVGQRDRHGGRGLRQRADGRRCRSPQRDGLGRQSRPGGTGHLRRRHGKRAGDPAGGRGRARHLHLRAGRQGLHQRRDDRHRDHCRSRDAGDGVYPRRSAAAPSRAEPRRADHLRQPGLAQPRRRGAAVCGDRHRHQPRQLWADERQRGGTIAWTAPLARRRDVVRGARRR